MVAQTSLGAVEDGSDAQTDATSNTETDSEQATDNADEDPYAFVEYLDVDSLKLIKGLAGSISSVDEADKFIEAEEKRWNRDDVLRILRARRDDLTADEPDLKWRL